jgi:hypothetical protein
LLHIGYTNYLQYIAQDIHFTDDDEQGLLFRASVEADRSFLLLKLNSIVGWCGDWSFEDKVLVTLSVAME